MKPSDVTLTLNGRQVTKATEPRTHLADFLREEHLLTGTHLGCEQGVCGACTLFVDGRPVRSCITLAGACRDAEVRTVEGFDDDPLMARLRAAFKRHHGLQCGFCTPGMLATAYDIVRRLPGADAPRIRRELSGNLCRCTGYAGIVAAIQDVLAGDPPAATVVPTRRARTPRTRQDEAAGAAAAPEPTAQASPKTSALTSAAAVRFEDFADPAALSDGVGLSRSLLLDAPPEQVWPVLADVPTVVSCIPGAGLDAPLAGEALQGHCIVSVGPMRATFRGVAAVRYDEAARSGRVVGRGRDGLSRSSLEGALDFALAEAGDGRAKLDLRMVYRLKGPLAQFGRPALVEEIADRLLADVSAALADRAAGRTPAAAPRRSLGGLALLGAGLRGMVKRFLRRT